MESFNKASEIDPEFEDALKYKKILENQNVLQNLYNENYSK